MQTHNYETVFIINSSTADTRLQEIAAKNQQIIQNFHGKVLNVDDWGKRKLSYPIRKEFRGHYVCLTYAADNQCVAELERNLRINEDVMRFLTVRLDEKVDPMQAIAAYKTRLEAHARREKEKAERDAERNMNRPPRGGFRGPVEEVDAPEVETVAVETEEE